MRLLQEDELRHSIAVTKKAKQSKISHTQDSMKYRKQITQTSLLKFWCRFKSFRT